MKSNKLFQDDDSDDDSKDGSNMNDVAPQRKSSKTFHDEFGSPSMFFAPFHCHHFDSFIQSHLPVAVRAPPSSSLSSSLTPAASRVLHSIQRPSLLTTPAALEYTLGHVAEQAGKHIDPFINQFAESYQRNHGANEVGVTVDDNVEKLNQALDFGSDDEDADANSLIINNKGNDRLGDTDFSIDDVTSSKPRINNSSSSPTTASLWSPPVKTSTAASSVANAFNFDALSSSALFLSSSSSSAFNPSSLSPVLMNTSTNASIAANKQAPKTILKSSMKAKHASASISSSSSSAGPQPSQQHRVHLFGGEKTRPSPLLDDFLSPSSSLTLSSSSSSSALPSLIALSPSSVLKGGQPDHKQRLQFDQPASSSSTTQKHHQSKSNQHGAQTAVRY
jgi:hypothetical protein